MAMSFTGAARSPWFRAAVMLGAMSAPLIVQIFRSTFPVFPVLIRRRRFLVQPRTRHAWQDLGRSLSGSG
jgi:hypothetical protein